MTETSNENEFDRLLRITHNEANRKKFDLLRHQRVYLLKKTEAEYTSIFFTNFNFYEMGVFFSA